MPAATPALRAALSALPADAPWAVLDCDEEGTLIVIGEDGRVQPGPDWVEEARALLGKGPVPCTGGPAPGLVGWLGYEAGRWCERMPAPTAPRSTPDLCLWRPRAAWWLPHAPDPAPTPLPPAPLPAPVGEEARYVAAVEALLEHIREGDVYQANLAWQTPPLPCPDPVEAWLRLRAHNPARRGALLQIDGLHIVSNSPELFLRVLPPQVEGRGSVARSAPIKGTAPGTAAGRAHLEASAKERAELTMIVDMVRNDLGRVARPGGVRAHPRGLVRCGDLWHAEQLVEAEGPEGVDALDWVRAAFPPASVTGAPKVRAMELIAALEAAPRGVYTGAIGWLGIDGDAHLNVAIRTLICAGGVARLHVGAGIVAASLPAAEWAETCAKAGAVLRALGAPPSS
ncbi:MAG: chorismate-binding protein [Deltaproteobacteria bacterium]|nr:chorismate-binding protein [Deltaproteobacteria bacterium]